MTKLTRNRKISIIATAMLALMACSTGIGIASGATLSTSPAIADAMVSGYPGETDDNYGTLTSAKVGTVWLLLLPFERQMVMSFNFSTRNPNATEAYLAFWVSSAEGSSSPNDPVILELWTAINTWSETAVTYDTRPDKVAKMGEVTVGAVSQWYRIPITSAVFQQNGTVSFLLFRKDGTSSSSNKAFQKIVSTREAGTQYQPRIEWGVPDSPWQWLIDLFMVPINLITTIITLILSIFGLAVIRKRSSRNKMACNVGDVSCT